MEVVWPNITKGKISNRTKGEWSIKIKEEQVEEYGVMNDVGNSGDLVLMWHIWKEENDRWMEENHSLYLDFNSQNEFMTETTEQPSDLIITLLRHQKEWLAWASKHEESIDRGGILADEMGMGKIVQAIALVLAKHEIGQAISDSGFLSPAPYVLQAVKGTLVICPVVAVIQWVNEIDRFTKKGSKIILVYHGANREKNIVDRPYLVECSSSAWARSGRTTNVEQACGLCLDLVEDPIVRLILAHMSFASPSCFKTITVNFTTTDQKTKATIKGFRSSSILNNICLDKF
ncbi:hypothetical protein H5410_028318 [Solanum commersonii]|uniref:SNF2 N-terminal domain-containing protein n=1 Tax=Solanum commersonii TaxID=4109 RepID=A0A9J5Z2C3_SOLCO|nr:hypothetical protein H5410_028318 [Solanum commersonii]